MNPLYLLRRSLPASIKSASIKLLDPDRECFVCPLCGYSGPFLQYGSDSLRQDACCPNCESLERHRLIWLIFGLLSRDYDLLSMRALHFAPEPCLRKGLVPMFYEYMTADISGRNVDHQVDICNLPFPDASFDVVIASHVLHYIRDEASALRSLWRVLSRGGMAIIPVPIFSEATVEYPQPIGGQMRAPGQDYFDRCKSIFGSVRSYSSPDFDPQYQVWIHEDRSRWPAPISLRPCSTGKKHKEYVPVCFR